SVSTLIYFLLQAGEVSRWHKVDATEVWHFYAGAPLQISVSPNGSETSVHRLGPDLTAGERPQFVVPAHCWQSAKSLGPWTLAGTGPQLGRQLIRLDPCNRPRFTRHA